MHRQSSLALVATGVWKTLLGLGSYSLLSATDADSHPPYNHSRKSRSSGVYYACWFVALLLRYSSRSNCGLGPSSVHGNQPQWSELLGWMRVGCHPPSTHNFDQVSKLRYWSNERLSYWSSHCLLYNCKMTCARNPPWTSGNCGLESRVPTNEYRIYVSWSTWVSQCTSGWRKDQILFLDFLLKDLGILSHWSIVSSHLIYWKLRHLCLYYSRLVSTPRYSSQPAWTP